MRNLIVVGVLAGSLASGCGKKKTCTTATADSFVGKAPTAELGKALGDLASRNKVCTVMMHPNIIMAGSRPDAVDTIEAALKVAGFVLVPGRVTEQGRAIVFGFARTRDEKTGDLVELSLTTGDDCEAGDVCVENLGYSVVPR